MRPPVFVILNGDPLMIVVSGRVKSLLFAFPVTSIEDPYVVCTAALTGMLGRVKPIWRTYLGQSRMVRRFPKERIEMPK